MEPQPPAPSSPDALARMSSEESSQKKMDSQTESKSKPESSVFKNQPLEPTIKTVRLDISSGCDIVEMVQKFAQQHRVGLHVIGGSGYICNFTLLNTSFMSLGVFDLVTLSGTFMDSTMIGSVGEFPCYLPTRPWLRATFLGADRELLGGIVASELIAATDVVVHAITFKSYEIELLNPTEYMTLEQQQVQDGGQGGKCKGSPSSSIHPGCDGFGGVGGGPLGGSGGYGIYGNGGC